MRGTTAKKLRKAAKEWMAIEVKVTSFRMAYQTLKKRYKRIRRGQENASL